MKALTNIDQIRARNALHERARRVKKDKNEGDNLSGFPSLIINNGLLPALAFALHKGEQHERIADAIAFHLNECGIISSENGKELCSKLCQDSSITLRRASLETLAFLAYLKRFY